MTLEDLVGRELGSYRILSLLGSGGMGAVYLGEHRSIGHKAAIKVLRAELAGDAEAAGRFFNEARAVNLIPHPGIVQIFDYGHQDGVGAYLVMELLQGISLGDHLRRHGPMAPEAAVDVLRQAASALGAAHQHGLIHRDLKPDNAFLVADDALPSGWRTKILDFGIAKLARIEAGPVKTRTGQLVGTPHYMAPEYIHGGKTFDHRIDIYSLGVIAYEILCGELPFNSEGLGELLLAQMVATPRPLRSLRPDLPESLESAVLRALAKNPAERFATMDELARALASAVGTPVRGRTGEVVATPPRPHGPPAAYAATISPATPGPPREVNRAAGAAAGPPSTLSVTAAELRAAAVAAPLAGATSPRRPRRLFVALGGAAFSLAAVALLVISGGSGGSGARAPDVAAERASDDDDALRRDAAAAGAPPRGAKVLDAARETGESRPASPAPRNGPAVVGPATVAAPVGTAKGRTAAPSSGEPAAEKRTKKRKKVEKTHGELDTFD